MAIGPRFQHVPAENPSPVDHLECDVDRRLANHFLALSRAESRQMENVVVDLITRVRLTPSEKEEFAQRYRQAGWDQVQVEDVIEPTLQLTLHSIVTLRMLDKDGNVKRVAVRL